MDLNVSSVSFGKSTRNWGEKGLKAPEKVASRNKKLDRRAVYIFRNNMNGADSPHGYIKKCSLEGAMQSLRSRLKGLSLSEIMKAYPKL